MAAALRCHGVPQCLKVKDYVLPLELARSACVAVGGVIPRESPPTPPGCARSAGRAGHSLPVGGLAIPERVAGVEGALAATAAASGPQPGKKAAPGEDHRAQYALVALGRDGVHAWLRDGVAHGCLPVVPYRARSRSWSGVGSGRAGPSTASMAWTAACTSRVVAARSSCASGSVGVGAGPSALSGSSMPYLAR